MRNTGKGGSKPAPGDYVTTELAMMGVNSPDFHVSQRPVHLYRLMLGWQFGTDSQRLHEQHFFFFNY